MKHCTKDFIAKYGKTKDFYPDQGHSPPPTAISQGLWVTKKNRNKRIVHKINRTKSTPENRKGDVITHENKKAREYRMVTGRIPKHKKAVYLVRSLEMTIVDGKAVLVTWDWPMTKELVKQRDNYTCRKCGVKKPAGQAGKGFLEVDHAHPLCYFYPKHALSLNKLQTLCKRCHRKMPKFASRSGLNGPRSKNWRRYCFLPALHTPGAGDYPPPPPDKSGQTRLF